MTDKKKKIIGYVFLGISLILAIITTGVIGKYITTKNSESTIIPEDFYFTIDLLGDTNTNESLNRNIDLYGGNDKTIEFNVQNYFDSLRFSDYSKLEYADPVVDSGSSYNDVTFTKGTEVVSGNLKTIPYTMTIENGYEEGDVVKVIVQSTKPYKKTLSLIFTLHTTGAPVTYRIEDSADSNFASLIIMSNIDLMVGDLVVEWKELVTQISVDTTSEFILDEDTLALPELTADNSTDGVMHKVVISKKIMEKESIKIIFFKSDPKQNYSADDTAVTLTGDVYLITLD